MLQRGGVEIVTIEIRIVENEKYIAIIKSMELLPKHIVERRVKFVRIIPLITQVFFVLTYGNVAM